MKVQDLNEFKNFNQFFTRELKEDCRSVDAPTDENNLCSPCDGRVLSFGTVDSQTSTLDCIKGHNYRVDEFLFGNKLKRNAKGEPTIVERMV
mmetsp:Transcript_17161/g.12183  ORF Transcript_17161/g.12183 Transcript_17161/m.12183 type:complete len:92 (-) Transcript_17161:842-1117(-)